MASFISCSSSFISRGYSSIADSKRDIFSGQVDYVLGHFTDEDWKTMDERLEMAGEIIKSFCLAGIDITMNQFNKK